MTDEDFYATLDEFLNAKSENNLPVEEKFIWKEQTEKNDPPFSFKGTVFNDSVPIDNAVKDLHSCGLGEFIAVLCCSFSLCLYDEEYSPFMQVWFTDEEAAEKCNSRGYTITAEQARKYLGQLLEHWDKLLEDRSEITTGRREYRLVRLTRENAEKYFRVYLPPLRYDWPPPLEYRTRYNRGKTYKR